MAVTVYDRHSKSWEYPKGATVSQDPEGLELEVLDPTGVKVGGFNPAAWSHYTVEDHSVGFVATIQRITELAIAAKKSQTPADVAALLKEIFWTYDQYTGPWAKESGQPLHEGE